MRRQELEIEELRKHINRFVGLRKNLASSIENSYKSKSTMFKTISLFITLLCTENGLYSRLISVDCLDLFRSKYDEGLLRTVWLLLRFIFATIDICLIYSGLCTTFLAVIAKSNSRF
jgi:hypothetical protein